MTLTLWKPTQKRQELIDTQWDVNACNCTDWEDECRQELIDTQRDVNLIGCKEFPSGFSELIDTQWDVNKVGFVQIPADVWN